MENICSQMDVCMSIAVYFEKNNAMTITKSKI